MKKICSLLISVCLCATLFCQTNIWILSADQSNLQRDAQSATIVDLVRLKKHIVAMKEYIEDFDYNNDQRIDSLDVGTLRKLLLGLPVDTDNQDKKPELDEDGYYKPVVKPQLLGVEC